FQPHMKSLLAILVFTLLAIAPAYAASYRVELIVFRNLHPNNLPQPPLKPKPVKTIHAVDIHNPTALVNNGIHPKSGGLAGIWDALARSADYHPVLRVSWTQQGRGQSTSVPLRIHGKTIWKTVKVRGRDRTLYRLDGTAELVTEPYLQLQLNLELIRPAST